MTLILYRLQRKPLRSSIRCLQILVHPRFSNSPYRPSKKRSQYSNHDTISPHALGHNDIPLRTLCSRVPDSGREVSNWNVANAVTIGRVIAAPLTGYCIMSGNYGLALTTLVYAGVSDWADGFLARRFKLQTVLGSYLDPAADKLLITSTTVCLAAQDVIPTWLVGLIVVRDVALVTGWALLRARRQQNTSINTGIKPLFISKVNTSLQITLSFAGVLCAGDWGIVGTETIHTIGLATATTTTLSGISYAYQYLGDGWRHNV